MKTEIIKYGEDSGKDSEIRETIHQIVAIIEKFIAQDVTSIETIYVLMEQIAYLGLSSLYMNMYYHLGEAEAQKILEQRIPDLYMRVMEAADKQFKADSKDVH